MAAAGSDTSPSSLAVAGKKIYFGVKPGLRWPRLEKRYKILDFLGKGNFASVHRGQNLKTGKIFALKIVTKKDVDLTRLAEECQILDSLKHPHIMGFEECIETKTRVIMVCELLEGGELFERILKKGSYSEKETITVIKHLLDALEYAHSKGVVHRDLKPENLILTRKDDDCDIKISDFGLAKMMTEKMEAYTLCGTPMYVAPELLSPQKNPYGPKVDVWAVGVITYIMLAGYPPFFDQDLAKLYRSILSVDLCFDDEYWCDHSPESMDFICHLLVADPESRPTAAEAKNHPWLASTGSSSPPAGLDSRFNSFYTREAEKVKLSQKHLPETYHEDE